MCLPNRRKNRQKAIATSGTELADLYSSFRCFFYLMIFRNIIFIKSEDLRKTTFCSQRKDASNWKPIAGKISGHRDSFLSLPISSQAAQAWYVRHRVIYGFKAVDICGIYLDYVKIKWYLCLLYGFFKCLRQSKAKIRGICA